VGEGSYLMRHRFRSEEVLNTSSWPVEQSVDCVDGNDFRAFDFTDQVRAKTDVNSDFFRGAHVEEAVV
jgi:hypothetical protein